MSVNVYLALIAAVSIAVLLIFMNHGIRRGFAKELKAVLSLGAGIGVIMLLSGVFAGFRTGKTANLILSSMEKNRPIDISSLPVTDSVPKTMLLQNMLQDIRREREDIAVGAVQDGMEVYPREDTAVKIERMLWKELNPEAIHLFTPKELIVLENGFFPNRAGMPDFGFTYTIMPLNKLTAVNLSRSNVYSLLMECTIYLGPNQLTYHYGVDNEEVGDFYTALKNL